MLGCRQLDRRSQQVEQTKFRISSDREPLGGVHDSRRGSEATGPDTCQRPKCRYIFGLSQFRVVQPHAGPRRWRERGGPQSGLVLADTFAERLMLKLSRLSTWPPRSAARGDRLRRRPPRKPPATIPAPPVVQAPPPADPGADPSRPDRRIAETLSRRAARTRGRTPRPRPRGVRSRHRRAAGRRQAARGPSRALREHFDRLVDRISALEVAALAAGRRLHGEAERAGVDRRAASTWLRPPRQPPTPRADGHGRNRPRADVARHPHPAQRARAVVRRAVPGPAARLHPGRARSRQRLPADDPERVPRRRAAARPGLRAAHRERVQDQRAVARQGQGRLAVHARHRRSRTA